MSQHRNNLTLCTHCGKPKAPRVTTNQARAQAPWPTYWQDLKYVAHALQALVAHAEGEPVIVNGRRMGVPPIPAFLPTKGLKVNPAVAETPAKEKPVFIGGRRMGVPPIPAFLPPKDAA